MKRMDQKEQLFSLLINGSVRIKTDCGTAELKQFAGCLENGELVYDLPFAKVSVSVYEKFGATCYRSVRLLCKRDVTLYCIEFEIELIQEPESFIEYKSFINAPTAVFIRYKEMGFYTGVENPFFKARKEKNEVWLSYEPSLILKAGEVYESEPQFIGYYQCTGEYIKENEPVNIEALERGILRPRFFNPCGETELDLAEISAMRKYVQEYYDVIEKEFENILYFFFYPKKQFPETEEEVHDYLTTIDRFKEMSGDIIAFNPHVKTVIPTEETPYWELAPEHSAAEKILHYAQDKGLRCGYYMGCAFNGEGGNAALLPFRPDQKAWKKVDAFGNLGSENCLGCDEYLDWWYMVQKNTIEKYDLGYWAWDPGPGNGNDCYALNHGHIPGKGEYKGWRNSQKLLARMKKDFPKLFLMSFYGRKEYGIWGFRYFSQHEVYWEQTVLFGATLHNDLDDDRINAHGTRLQNQWCMNFRFLPAELGHGLVSRMGESWFDPALDQAYDFRGFRYALLSAIACCGSITHCNIPDCLENVPGYKEFYQKWIRWAKDNYRYCTFTRPIGDRVSNELIDGFARIDGDSGQMFLFNSSPKVMNKRLVLDEKLGLHTEECFYLRLLYCEGAAEYADPDYRCGAVQYRDAYRMGDVLDITLPPYGAVVLEVTREDVEMTNRTVEKITEIPRYTHTIDQFTDLSGEIFLYPYHNACESIALTAEAVFCPELKTVLDNSHIKQEAFLMKKISEWHKDGIPFTLTSTLPHRLVMYLPFEGAKLPESVRLFINDAEVPVEVFCLRKIPVFHYAFVEDYVKWGVKNQIRLEIQNLAKNSFMGIYVDYPDVCEGMNTKEQVFPERIRQSNLHFDPALKIDSFVITPDILSDKGETFIVSVKTAVDQQQIEAVYYLHPTQPQMPELTYDPEKKLWIGTFDSGKRAQNIFCNGTILAWIKGKNGGVGPRAECSVRVQYTKDKME